MKPLLKWAGGKRWLLPILKDLWAPHAAKRLVEPFTGGMAVALGLNPDTAVLNDANVHLINLYQQVKKGLHITQALKNNSDFYYEQRETFNELIRLKKFKNKQAASIFYYLIRTGFNGLCRFNNKGEFNVPFGQHKTIRYKTGFLEYKTPFKKWDLQSGDFEALKLKTNDFLYVDPPYDVEFTKYNRIDFKWQDQERLAEWLLGHKGPIVASNQATDRILELYQDLKFNVFVLPAPRTISCNGDRKPALEILALRGFEAKILKKLASKLK